MPSKRKSKLPSTRQSQKKRTTETLLQRSVIRRPFRRRLQWPEQAMIDAMKEVEDGMPVATAAREHSVPRTSLQNRMSGKVTHGKRPGRKPYLDPDEETQLAEFIIECASVGYGKTRIEIMTIAENTARDKKVKERQDYTWLVQQVYEETTLPIIA